MTVTFLVRVGKHPIPENQVESFGAIYVAEGKSYDPKCIFPDRTIGALPENGRVPLDHKLLFVDVPEAGELVPKPYSSLGIGCHRMFLNPAIDGMEYLLNFETPMVAVVKVSEGTRGQVCQNCHGLGYTWENIETKWQEQVLVQP